MKNKVILLGRVGKDPEVRHTQDGTTVAKLSLATTEKYKNKQGEKVENTEWHNVVFWRGVAEVVEKYVKKGNLILVEGKIKYGDYTDKDGVKRYTTDIIAENLDMIPTGSTGAKEAEKKEEPKAELQKEEPNDLPF